MSSKNDVKILELKKRIDEKKNEIGKIKRFSPITNCSLSLDNIRYNLNVIDEESTIYLLIKIQMYILSAESLNLENSFTIDGYSLMDWKSDLEDRLSIIKQKKELDNLKAMEKKLTNLLSNEKQTELEIDEIAAML